MSYTISYTPQNDKKYPTGKKRSIWPFAVAAVLAVSLLFAPVRNTLKNILLPGNPEVTEQAIACFSREISRGEGLGSAITAFCQYVIDNAHA